MTSGPGGLGRDQDGGCLPGGSATPPHLGISLPRRSGPRMVPGGRVRPLAGTGQNGRLRRTWRRRLLSNPMITGAFRRWPPAFLRRPLPSRRRRRRGTRRTGRADPAHQQRAVAACSSPVLSLFGLLGVSNFQRGVLHRGASPWWPGRMAIWLAGTALARTRRGGTAGPRGSVTAIVIGGVGVLLSGILLARASRCSASRRPRSPGASAGPTPIAAQQACQNQFIRAVGSSGSPGVGRGGGAEQARQGQRGRRTGWSRLARAGLGPGLVPGPRVNVDAVTAGPSSPGPPARGAPAPGPRRPAAPPGRRRSRNQFTTPAVTAAATPTSSAATSPPAIPTARPPRAGRRPAGRRRTRPAPRGRIPAATPQANPHSGAASSASVGAARTISSPPKAPAR